MNVTASALLDQAAQKLLDAVYEEFLINSNPITKAMMDIGNLPEHEKYDMATNLMETYSPDAVAKVMIRALKSGEERKSARAAYCEARQLASAFENTAGL